MSVLNIILKSKIIAILRGADPADALKIIQSLGEGGIVLAEITMNSPGALRVIGEATKKHGDKLIIGAGTVLDAATAKDAISAGAKFIISPSVNTEVIETTKKYGAVSIPGAFTATEIVTAWSAGGDIIKVFPAPGVQYIKDIRGPLSHIPLMPTGGVNLENILAFFKAGAVAAGIGSALADTKQKITAEYLQTLKNKAEKFVEIIANI
jgi:2-dehydro-3-deoxyphosphogluconate aldolase/(4S)-4-hydroxy-2-oxoglutarate aldolase